MDHDGRTLERVLRVQPINLSKLPYLGIDGSSNETTFCSTTFITWKQTEFALSTYFKLHHVGSPLNPTSPMQYMKSRKKEKGKKKDAQLLLVSRSSTVS